MPRIALIMSIPALALGLAACGDQTADLEKSVTEEVQRGYPEAKVDCPSDVDTDKGATFSCKVSGVGEISEVTYEVIDDDGNVAQKSTK